jgi:uncharacterized membrane protein
MNLEKRLTRWTEAGLLSAEQARSIKAWEQEQPSASWVLFGITGLGIVVLMTGVVSIIAANWDQIPPSVKLWGYFISLSVLGWAAAKRYGTPGVIRECLLTAYAAYVLGGIGLIGQLYHLSAEGYEALFTWLTLVLPIALLAQSRLINNLWCVVLLSACALWLFSSAQHEEAVRIYTIAAAPWITLGVGYLLWNRFSFFSSALRVWSYGILLLGYAIVANIAWSAGGGLPDPLRHPGYAWALPFTGFVLALAAVWFRQRLVGRGLSIAIAFTLVALGALLMPPTYGSLDDTIFSQIMGCLLFIAAWSGAAAIAAGMERRRLFDFAALVIAIRFIVVYFEVFGSLAATGFGLMLSGAVILGIAYMWHSYRGTLAKAIKEGM